MSMRFMRTKLVLLFAGLLCVAAMASAQTLGDISGEIRDPSGAVIAGAKVVLTNTSTNAIREATTNESGIYVFPALTPGVYNMRVEQQGFKAVTRSNIEVQVQQSTRLDLEMTVGSVSEAVEISAQAALLTSESSTVGTVIDNQRIVDLPLNGRNALSLAAVSPHVSYGFPSAGQAGSRQGGVRADRSISIAGQRSQFNHFTLDGIENTDPNFNSYVVEPSVDALQEFKVQTGIYPAEFGRGTAQVNMSTKAGSNNYHGTAYEFLRNEKLDAKNYAFTTARPPKDPFKWNQFGFTLGGPVLIPKIFNGKNRLFFMTNYEWFRQRRNVQALFTVPTAASRNGDFSALPFGTQGIWDPATRPNPGAAGGTQFPGNVIPQGRITEQSKKLLDFLPLPNLPTATQNYQAAQGRPIDRDQFTGRGDFVESSNSQWFGRYSWGDEGQLTEALRLNGDKIVTNFRQIMVTNTRVLSSSVVNEARFGYSKFYNTAGPELAFTRDVVGELGIPGLASGPPVQWGIPNVALDHGLSGFGNGSEGPYENNNRSIQFINNLSWTRGKHSFKFGGEFRNDVYRQVGNQFARGQFSFIRNATRNPGVSGVTGDSFADFLLGQPYQAEAAVAIATADFRASTFYLYVDDTWKVTRNLTLNLGLRYENTPPWEDQTGKLFNLIVPYEHHPTDFRNAVAPRNMFPYFMRQGTLQNCFDGISIGRWPAPIAPLTSFGQPDVRCDGSLGNRLVARDNNDFAPRLGLTWAPTQKWVIRGGGGMFYTQDSGNPRFDMARNLAGRGRDNSDTKFLTWANAVPTGGTLPERPYAFANLYDRRTPYSIQYMLNVQRELPWNTLFEVGYLGSQSHRLEALRSVNEALEAPRTSGLSVAQRSPFPNLGIVQLVDNNGNANYNSLGAKLSKRFSGGLTYLASYTWSKSIDTFSAIRNQGNDTLFPQNSYCRECERALSSFDTRHRFVTSALWELPFGKGRPVNIDNSFVNAVAGGWQLGSIITLQSGFPLLISQSGDPSNTGHTFDRPNATGISPYDGWDSTTARWFNPAAYTRTPDGFHGNVGRGSATTPGIFSWDFSMHKDFKFLETHRVQFRFEAFNFPNHPVWGNPNGNIISGTIVDGIGSNFGIITGTRTNMRNLQLALKYIF
jgi:outer membrane receptor protein involved in Fe transport